MCKYRGQKRDWWRKIKDIAAVLVPASTRDAFSTPLLEVKDYANTILCQEGGQSNIEFG